MNNKNNIRRAVSFIFFVKGDLFTITRQNYLKAFPGYLAFPGGKVDKIDLVEVDKVADLQKTLMNTLVREAKEELDFCFDAEMTHIISLNLCFKATSPSHNPSRYETYFYVIELEERPLFTLDRSEIFSSSWCTPAELKLRYEEGNMLVVPPIRVIFDQIESGEYKNYDEAKYLNITGKNEEERLGRTACVEYIKNIIQLMPLSNTILPAVNTNCFLIGSQGKQILIDPSPKNEKELERLMIDLELHRPVCIFITHHHPDHHQHSTAISKRLNIPIYISKDSFLRIKAKHGSSYFDHCTVKLLQDGDQIGDWLGESLTVYEIPGHDQGHLGIAPKSLRWFIVGDLFQGLGTVVVGDDEGDMDLYLKSLQRVIKLEPKIVIPSHGIPLGGTDILEKTYKHRLMRESQILDFLKRGLSVEDIFIEIYSEVPKSVVKYARKNIESHIVKIRRDGLI